MAKADKILIYNGVVLSIADWAHLRKIPVDVLVRRLLVNKWTPERALETPVRKQDRHHTERRVWRNMVGRCHDPRLEAYLNYGALPQPYRVTVCERWRRSFDRFLEDMGPRRSKGSTVGRIFIRPVELGADGAAVTHDISYRPENCLWVSHNQASRAYRVFLQEELDWETEEPSKARIQAEANWAKAKSKLQAAAARSKTKRKFTPRKPSGPRAIDSLADLTETAQETLRAVGDGCRTATEVGVAMGFTDDPSSKVASTLERLVVYRLVQKEGFRPRRYTLTAAGSECLR